MVDFIQALHPVSQVFAVCGLFGCIALYIYCFLR